MIGTANGQLVAKKQAHLLKPKLPCMRIIQRDTLCVTGYACNYLTSIKLTLARTEYLNQKAFIHVSCSKSINRCLSIRQCVICFVWLQTWYGAAIPQDSGMKLLRKVKVRLTVPTPYVDIADQYRPKSRLLGMILFIYKLVWSVSYHFMGLLPDKQNCMLRMRRECREPRLMIPTCITARAWRTCRGACRDR